MRSKDLNPQNFTEFADEVVLKGREEEPRKEDTQKVNFYGLELDDLKDLLKKLGKESYRAQQLFKWVYQSRVTDFEEMSNISKKFRAELPDLISFELPKVVEHLVSKDGTQKFLFDVGFSKTVEAVLIPSDDRLTLCLSSEVGCNMACKFCFTGKQKLKRRLTADEIVGQFMQVHDRLKEGQRISNIVFMGMGEPLDNPEAVFKTIKVLHSTWGMNFSRRKVTVSTSGLVPQIPLITESGARLAVSLNAPNDEIRNFIMPINKKYNIKKLMDACREHTSKARDRVTFEYVLLKGVNDSIEHARQLRKIIRGVPCKLNLIPFNEHPGADFHRSDSKDVFRFQKEILNTGTHVTIRRTMGRDIFAACGQLTSHYNEHPKKQEVQTGILG